MKVSMEVFCADAQGRGVVALASDVELTLSATQVGDMDFLKDFHPHAIHSWTIHLPNGTLAWSALGWGKDDNEEET